jgi:flagellar L-ring protein FlgH
MNANAWKWLRVVIGVAFAAFAASGHCEDLYKSGRYRSFVSDQRAARVGDPVTVLIVETSTAESRADSAEDSEFGIEAGITDAVGTTHGGVSLDTESSGAGRTARAGRLTAQLTAKVERVLESGDLFIRGTQAITINGEQQIIKLEGSVRPLDVSAKNTVLSTRLADARIEYLGQGWVADNQKPGLFRRILQFIGF